MIIEWRENAAMRFLPHAKALLDRLEEKND